MSDTFDFEPGFYFTDTEYPEDYPDPGAGPFDTWDDAYDEALEYEIPPKFIQIRHFE